MNLHPSSDAVITIARKLDQRKETRTRCTGLVEVMTLGFRQRILSGTLQDMSPSGLCIHLNRRLSRGTVITTIVDNELIFGSVRYTVIVPDGVRTGIQIDTRRRR